jgi:hypothetical protein
MHGEQCYDTSHKLFRTGSRVVMRTGPGKRARNPHECIFTVLARLVAHITELFSVTLTRVLRVVVLGHRSLTIRPHAGTRPRAQRCRSSGLVRPPAQANQQMLWS